MSADTRLIMGMPITVHIVGTEARDDMEAVFAHFEAVDRRFSPYRQDSELSAINRGAIDRETASDEMREVLALAVQSKHETGGYFEIVAQDGRLDPLGIVKGWAIRNAAQRLLEHGFADFYVDAGGDIQSHGRNEHGDPWSVGIRHPFSPDQIVKTIYPKGQGVATSGSYVRGAHIYNPHCRERVISDIVSLTVIGPDVLEADRFATAAFAMGPDGIHFIDGHPGLEGYMIDKAGLATMTRGFGAFVSPC
jgi:FAD:protein FMN transferase